MENLRLNLLHPMQRPEEMYIYSGFFSKLESNRIGAAHCLDLPLLFGNEEAWKHAELLKGIPWAEIDKVGKKIRAIWAEFARNGSVSENSDKPEVFKNFPNRSVIIIHIFLPFLTAEI